MSYIINLISINKIRNNLSFKIFFSKRNVSFLNFLKKFNFIYKYTLIKNSENNATLINVYIYYYKAKNNPLTVKLITKPSKKISISYKALRLLNKKSASSIFLLSTPRGLLNHKDALKFRTTGLLIAFFSL